MITVKGNTTLVGVSELRTKWDEILTLLKNSDVIIEKGNTPVAALVSMEDFELSQKIIESAEDLVLGYISKERHRKSKKSDYIDIEKVEKKLKIK